MAFVRLAFFPGTTRSHYDVLAAHMPQDEDPVGRLMFAAGPVQGGWQVVQVWTSQEHLMRFNQEFFFPALTALGGSPFPHDPVVTDFVTAAFSLTDHT